MMSEFHQYPDIGDIFALKARGRLERASLTFSEKLEILDQLRKKVAPFVRAREARIGALQARPGAYEGPVISQDMLHF
jgi:hypothetical protein